ncbi:MAG: hypothetical protein FWC27_15530 [Firmicutes bacterium]|nr:hypothetical protein [Bacillota bacterium]
MSTELIRQVAVLSDGVYLHSKSNNDDIPFHTWKSDSLTAVYNREGQRGLDREIVKMLCEYARIDGHHPSIERYRLCVRPGRALVKRKLDAFQRAYAKLAPEDTATIYMPEEQRTPAAKAYRQFQKDTEATHQKKMAQLAARVTDKASRRREGAR